MDPPEHLKQLRVADLGRVEPHLDRLSMAGATPADPSVAGVRDVAAGVADSGLQHPVDLAEGRPDPRKHPAANVARSAPSGPSPAEPCSDNRARHRVVGLVDPVADGC